MIGLVFRQPACHRSSWHKKNVITLPNRFWLVMLMTMIMPHLILLLMKTKTTPTTKTTLLRHAVMAQEDLTSVDESVSADDKDYDKDIHHQEEETVEAFEDTDEGKEELRETEEERNDEEGDEDMEQERAADPYDLCLAAIPTAIGEKIRNDRIMIQQREVEWMEKMTKLESQLRTMEIEKDHCMVQWSDVRQELEQQRNDSIETSRQRQEMNETIRTLQTTMHEYDKKLEQTNRDATDMQRQKVISDELRKQINDLRHTNDQSSKKILELQDKLLNIRQELFDANQLLREKERWYSQRVDLVVEVYGIVKSAIVHLYDMYLRPIIDQYVLPNVQKVWDACLHVWEVLSPYVMRLYHITLDLVQHQIPHYYRQSMNILYPKYVQTKTWLVHTLTPHYERGRIAIQPHYEKVRGTIQPHYDQASRTLQPHIQQVQTITQPLINYIPSTTDIYQTMRWCHTITVQSVADSAIYLDTFVTANIASSPFLISRVRSIKNYPEHYVIYMEGIILSYFVWWILRKFVLVAATNIKKKNVSAAEKTKMDGKKKSQKSMKTSETNKKKVKSL
jgi:hypothetical protein